MARTQNVPAIVTLLAGMLSRLAPTQGFVIVDRFLLPKSKSPDYLNTGSIPCFLGYQNWPSMLGVCRGQVKIDTQVSHHS